MQAPTSTTQRQASSSLMESTPPNLQMTQPVASWTAEETNVRYPYKISNHNKSPCLNSEIWVPAMFKPRVFSRHKQSLLHRGCRVSNPNRLIRISCKLSAGNNRTLLGAWATTIIWRTSTRPTSPTIVLSPSLANGNLEASLPVVRVLSHKAL